MDIWSKNYKFIIVGGKVIRSQEAGKVYLSLQNGTTMTLLNVIYTSKCNSNLILLGQLQELGILYHNYPNSIILKQKGSTLRMAGRYKNLFIFGTSLKEKAMLV